MSSASVDDLTRPTRSRPVGLIAGIVALEALTFAISDYSAFGGFGAALPGLLLDGCLLRGIWRGSSAAWYGLVVLNVGLIALSALTLFDHHVQIEGGPLALARVALELALLAAPSMRRWVAQG